MSAVQSSSSFARKVLSINDYACSAPEEHHVYSLEFLDRCALQLSAMCFSSSTYMPLLTERANAGRDGYKHFAPPEQEIRVTSSHVTPRGNQRARQFLQQELHVRAGFGDLVCCPS